MLDDQILLKGIEPRKAFDNLVKEREKAKIAFERERASDRFSKLANAVGRKAASYRPGQLVMVWRQKVKPGKVKGNWTGPVRLVLMEGSTAWLVSGATLIRAKLNQIRPTTKREDLEATLEGAGSPNSGDGGGFAEFLPGKILHGRLRRQLQRFKNLDLNDLDKTLGQ